MPLGVGLECGSKAELQAILGITESIQPIIVCNGYKDEEYMRLALMGQKLGHTVFVVLEQLSELDTLLKVADELGVSPTVGVRDQAGSRRLRTLGQERRRKVQVRPERRRADEAARQAGELWGGRTCSGWCTSTWAARSPTSSTSRRRSRRSAASTSSSRKMGFELTHVDVGGGLGVDYDGSRSTRPASMNYSMREYANDVVYTLGTLCRAEGVPMPNIISESGRAITAHHALLLINVTDVESQIEPVPPKLGKGAHPLLVEIKENLESLSPDRLQEVHHDATFGKERAQELFASGVLTLRDRADVETFYLCTMNALAHMIEEDKAAYPEIVGDVESTLVDRYFCNFSVFQSLPDNWAIDQLFPIMPIHRLDEQPTRRGTIQDITCDSDGVIDRFVGGRKGKPSLELHPVKDDEPYILGIFLTGAYQEILGDLHNLFGDTNAVHIRLTEQGYEVTDLVHGDTVTEVLNYVQFHASDLLTTFRRKVTNAKDLARQDANQFIADYVAGLEGYTYLEGEELPGT